MDKVIETKSQMIMRIAELSEENSKLKGKLDAYKMSENEANEIIAELKAENQQLQSKNESYDKERYYYYNLSEKYRQALQEIRDMADFKCALPSKELCHCKACDYADNIIDKINSVIGAEEWNK